MGFELFVANRIHFNQKGEKRVSRPAVRIAICGIAISVAVMLLAVGIVVGFKDEVRGKLIGFGAHIQVTSSVLNQTYETQPIHIDSVTFQRISTCEGVCHAQKFATQPGILKVNEDFQGIVMKGIDKDFDWDFFRSNLREGDIFTPNDSVADKRILISQKIADLLQLSVGDDLLAYFIINGKVRVRPLTVHGIYSTGFSDYDKMFILGDIRHIRKLNGWDETQCSGVEILTSDYSHLDPTAENIHDLIGNQRDKEGNYFMIKTIRQVNPQIFNWLDLLDMNAIIILFLMICVASFTMISGLLILILERTHLIGVLKALGATNWSIRKTFLYLALYLVGKGILIGDLLAIACCFVQQRFGLIQLDPDTYYIDKVPIHLSISKFLLINIGTIFLSILVLIGPSFLITKISPVKTIRFE